MPYIRTSGNRVKGGGGGSGLTLEYYNSAFALLRGSFWINYISLFSLTADVALTIPLLDLCEKKVDGSALFIGLDAGSKFLITPGIASPLEVVLHGGLELFILIYEPSWEVTPPMHMSVRALFLAAPSRNSYGGMILLDGWFMTVGLGYFLGGFYGELGLTLPIGFPIK